MVLICLYIEYCSQLAVYTSAYPPHYKEALASCTILLSKTTKVCQTPLTAYYETRFE